MNEGWVESDRRAFPRIPTNVWVRILQRESFSSELIDATLESISQAGALLVTSELVPVGQWIAIQPHQGSAVEVTGLVIRAETDGPGSFKHACHFFQPIDYSVMQLFCG